MEPTVSPVMTPVHLGQLLDAATTNGAFVFRSLSSGTLYMCSINDDRVSWSTSDGQDVTYLYADQVPHDLMFENIA